MPIPDCVKALAPVDVGDDGRIALAASLDVTAADPLQEQILARLAADAPVVLCGRDVQRISTACLQILVAARQRAQALGVGFAVTAPSAVLRQAVLDLGLGVALGFEAP